MNTLTENELMEINAGNAFITWGEQAAADGFSAMDSSNPVKQGVGMLLASAAGWVYMAGFAWDIL